MRDGGVYVSTKEQVSFRIIEGYRAGKLSRKEVAGLLGVTPETVSRRVARLRENGLEVLSCRSLTWQISWASAIAR